MDWFQNELCLLLHWEEKIKYHSANVADAQCSASGIFRTGLQKKYMSLVFLLSTWDSTIISNRTDLQHLPHTS